MIRLEFMPSLCERERRGDPCEEKEYKRPVLVQLEKSLLSLDSSCSCVPD